MKPAPFDYLRPDSLDEALQVLADHGDEARVIAGGQSLMAMLNMRLVRPGLLVDISRIVGLAGIRETDGWIEIGAATTQAELQAWPRLAAAAPLLDQAIAHIGHFQTRNRGTVCGSLAHADPSSELPLCLALLGGEVVLRSHRETRTLSAAEFQLGMLSTARRPDELVVAARYPVAHPGDGHAFREVARRHGDFAIVSLAARARGEETVLGVGGVADRPTTRDFGVLEGEALDDALNAFAWEMGGGDDIHASARYRRELVRRLGRQVIEEARQCRS